MKNKIIAILLILTTLLTLITLSGCGKKDTNTIVANTEQTETENTKTEVEIKSQSQDYYINELPKKKIEGIKYNNTFMLGDEMYNDKLIFMELAEKHTTLSNSKDIIIEPQALDAVVYDGLPRTTYVYFKNTSNQQVAKSSTTIYSVMYDVNKNTNLYDIIGEQIKKMKDDKSFLDNVIDFFGSPSSTFMNDKFVCLSYEFDKTYILVKYDLKEETGTFEITF